MKTKKQLTRKQQLLRLNDLEQLQLSKKPVEFHGEIKRIMVNARRILKGTK